MLYDLSIVWTPSTTAAKMDSTLAMSAELGYDVVALDYVYHGPVPTAVVRNPLPVLLEDPTKRRPRILRRATVVVSDTTLNHRLSAVAAAYDLLAVRPTTEKAFQAACLSMAEPALISLDLSNYFPFFFRHRAAMAAVRRGVHFEVCYGHALGGQTATPGETERRSPSIFGGDRIASASADRSRALFVSNLIGLVRATRGRGIVISSGARMSGAGPLELRSPADVANLMTVWGVAPDRAIEGLSGIPRSIVENEGLRRRGFRGVVDVVQGVAGAAGAAGVAGAAGAAAAAAANPVTATTGQTKGKRSKQQKQQKPKQQNQQQELTSVDRKRKATDAGPSDARPSAAGPSDAGPSEAGPSDAGPSDAGPPDTTQQQQHQGGEQRQAKRPRKDGGSK